MNKSILGFILICVTFVYCAPIEDVAEVLMEVKGSLTDVSTKNIAKPQEDVKAKNEFQKEETVDKMAEDSTTESLSEDTLNTGTTFRPRFSVRQSIIIVPHFCPDGTFLTIKGICKKKLE